MAGAKRLIASFVMSKTAVSAVEFALIFPFMIIMLLAGLQLILYINATRKIERVATAISEMISQASPPNSLTTLASVNMLDLHFSFDSTLALFPYVMSDAASKGTLWWKDISINFSSITFKQTSTSCGNNADQSSCYVATVVWTSTGTSTNFRPCAINQVAVDDNATPQKTTLPRSLFGPGSIIVIDVVFNYVPIFGSGFLPPINISRSVYVQPRYASLINFDPTNNDGIASICQ